VRYRKRRNDTPVLMEGWHLFRSRQLAGSCRGCHFLEALRLGGWGRAQAAVSATRSHRPAN